MNILQAIIYGLVQGVGEFLPISSSAHLIALPQLFGWQDPGLAFDVALHLGTLAAVIAYFWQDWLKLTIAGFTKTKSSDGKLFWFLVLASVPGAIIGKLFEEKAETMLRNLLVVGIMMILMGVILYLLDKFGRKDIKLEKIGLWRSFGIGISQALAIIPGVSRSGVTMSAGLWFGLTKETAARFSFLLSTPIIFGAGFLKLKEIIHTPSSQVHLTIIAVLVSALAGYLSIKFLLNYLQTKGFGIFAIYRLVFGVILLLFYFYN